MTRSNPCIFDDKSVTDDAEKRRIDNETGTGKINEVRLWWNGIHNGLKIRRRKLEGSNPSSRTNKNLAYAPVLLTIRQLRNKSSSCPLTRNWGSRYYYNIPLFPSRPAP